MSCHLLSAFSVPNTLPFPSQICTGQPLSEPSIYAVGHCNSQIVASLKMVILWPHSQGCRFKRLEWGRCISGLSSEKHLCLVGLFCLMNICALCQTQLKGLLCFLAFLGQRWSLVSILPRYFIQTSTKACHFLVFSLLTYFSGCLPPLHYELLDVRDYVFFIFPVCYQTRWLALGRHLHVYEMYLCTHLLALVVENWIIPLATLSSSSFVITKADLT